MYLLYNIAFTRLQNGHVREVYWMEVLELTS
jgi:hypothetical protein